MANELARNQTPNNWLSSYVNIAQEFQKVMYRKKLLEEAKQQAERGIEQGAEAMSPQFQNLSPPGYTASSPVYGSSPVYTASSPVYGSSPVVGNASANPYQSMGFGAAAAAASLQPQSPTSLQYTASSPVGSPIVLSGQPMSIMVPTNPLQAVMPIGAPGAPGSPGILSVEKQQPKEDEEKGEQQGKKTVFINSP
jgi:hypothetical protein